MNKDEEYMSVVDVVRMVNQKYSSVNDMITAHSNTSDPQVKALLTLAILVNVYVKVGKPADMRDEIQRRWNSLCDE